MMIHPFLQNFGNDKLNGGYNMAEQIKVIRKSRIVHKHDKEVNWNKATNFIPKQGELIVYDIDENYNYERFKIGDGITTVIALPFADESLVIPSTRVTHGDSNTLLYDIINNYLINIDYDTLLAFDTSEIVTGVTSTTSVLGQAILGQMVLA